MTRQPHPLAWLVTLWNLILCCSSNCKLQVVCLSFLLTFSHYPPSSLLLLSQSLIIIISSNDIPSAKYFNGNFFVQNHAFYIICFEVFVFLTYPDRHAHTCTKYTPHTYYTFQKNEMSNGEQHICLHYANGAIKFGSLTHTHTHTGGFQLYDCPSALCMLNIIWDIFFDCMCLSKVYEKQIVL